MFLGIASSRLEAGEEAACLSFTKNINGNTLRSFTKLVQ